MKKNLIFISRQLEIKTYRPVEYKVGRIDNSKYILQYFIELSIINSMLCYQVRLYHNSKPHKLGFEPQEGYVEPQVMLNCKVMLS